MAVPTTYALLQTEIAALSVREDLTDLIPNFIGYAESWFHRELFTPEREASATLTLTDNTAPLPTDFGGVKAIYVDGTSDSPIEEVSPSELRRRYPTNTTGTPVVYAIEGTDILFGPVPADGTAIVLKYIEGIAPLSDTNTTNWLLTGHPDIYVNASLAELYDYTAHEAKAGKCRAKAQAIAESILRQSRRRKGNSGPLVAMSRNTDAVLSYR